MKLIPFLIFLTFFTAKAQQIDSVFNKEKIIKTGLQAFFKKDTQTVKKSYKKLLNLYSKDRDATTLAKYYHYKALYFSLKYMNDSTFYYYNKSKDISKTIADSLEVGRRLLSIANLEREAKDYLGSEISSIEALEYLEPIKSYKYLESVYNNLGLISDELNKEKEALKYYDLALKINKLTEKSKRKETSYLYIINNIGLLYELKNEHGKAITYFKKGLAFDGIKTKYRLVYALLLENLVYSSYSSGNEKEVLEKYNEILQIRKKFNENYELPTIHINLGNYYNDKSEIIKAKYHVKEALKYAKQTHNNKRLLEALEFLSELTTGKQSKRYFREYITLNDSLIQKERQLKNQFAKIRYETDKKEKENTLLRAENENKEIEIYKERQQKIIIFIVGVVAIIISVLLFMLKRKKLLYKTTLQKTQATYKERDRIAQELHDGILGKLFGTRFGLGFIKVKGEKEEVDKYHRLLDKLKEIEKEIRDVSHKLSYTTNSTSENYNEMITKIIREKSAIGNFKYAINTASEVSWNAFNEEVKFNVYRIVQEALHNIIKHSKAKNITLSIYYKRENLIIEIEDDGVGFDVKKLSNGVGLSNIKSRVNKLKGSFNINSEIGLGATLKVKIPFV